MENLEAVHRDGLKRLYPSLTNPNWLILRRRRLIFQNWIALLDKQHLEVLDVGGRIQPYRQLLEGRVARYTAIDLQRTPIVNLIGRAEHIPFKAGQFDLVICTQVLQYVPDPAVVISEIHRVLKPGGSLLLSVPAIFPRDSDNDTWRFLPKSLHLLLHRFGKVEIEAEGSSLSGFFRTICVFLVMASRPAFFRAILQFTVVPILNLTAATLEFMFRNSRDEFSANFAAFARK